MKLPYGVSDFGKIRLGNYLYIDKTRFIEKVENLNSDYVFFIRPRRFGKSLFLSTLEHYYDINALDKFDRLFGDLYIGQHPTPLKNSYLVLNLDFSALRTDSKESLQRSFNLRLASDIISFIRKYQKYFTNTSSLEKVINETQDAGAILNFLIAAMKGIDKKMYLIIDEYDHFANDLIAVGENEFYRGIIRASGFVRDFYEAVKIGTKSVIDRIFITGASPVMLDDLTSGFNIAANITTNATLNEMLGFTAEELLQIIDSVNACKGKQELVQELRNYYNGYLFNINGHERVYNPDMVLYFFREWEDTGRYPKQLADDNVKTDYGKLERLVGNENNRLMLEKIIKEESVATNIITKFSFDRMYDEDNFVSLLFYMGLLTIKGEKYGQTELTIPNYVIRTLFWEYFEKALRNRFNIQYQTEELSKCIWQMGSEGRIEPFIEFVSENVLKQLSNRDLIGFDEKYIKLLLLAYLVNSNIFEPISEFEVEAGYIDLYLKRDENSRDARYEWIIELKYVKESERGKLEQVREDGLGQLKKYGASRRFLGRQDVKKALVIFVGKGEIEIVEG